MTQSPGAPGALNWARLMVLGFVWGSAFLAMDVALLGFPPLWVAAGRCAGAAVVLVATSPLWGEPTWRALGQAGRPVVPFVVLVGILATALPLALLAWGLQHVPSAFAGVAMGAVPLLLLPLAWLFLPEEGIGPRRVLGLVSGFVGLAILIGGGIFEEAGPLTTLGRLACVSAAFCYAVGSVLTRRAPPVSPTAFATGAIVVAAILLVPLAWAVEGPPPLAAPGPLAALLYTALFPTALCFVLRVQVIRSAGSIFMSLVSYLVPVWAVIFGVVLGGERLSGRFFLALALILGGIAISQSRSLARALKARARA